MSKWTDTVTLDCGAFNNQQMLQAAMECRGGLTVKEVVMMTTTALTSVPSDGVGKGDGNWDGDCDGDSDSGDDAFNNQQMFQATMECRGGMTVEEGAMMTTTELMNVLLGGVGKGDGDCDGDGDGDSDSGGNATINKYCRWQWNGGGGLPWRLGQ